MCVCLEEYIFLGSRLGNSLLVRFTEKDQNTVITIDDSDILGKEKEKGIIFYHIMKRFNSNEIQQMINFKSISIHALRRN